MLTQAQMQAIDDLIYASRNAIQLRSDEIDVCVITLYDAQQILSALENFGGRVDRLKDIILKQDEELEKLHCRDQDEQI